MIYNAYNIIKIICKILKIIIDRYINVLYCQYIRFLEHIQLSTEESNLIIKDMQYSNNCIDYAISVLLDYFIIFLGAELF